MTIRQALLALTVETAVCTLGVWALWRRLWKGVRR